MADMAHEPQVIADPARIGVIDLARGFAVLGILVINVTTMAGPGIAATTPNWHGHAAPGDWVTFLLTWLFFEGKMRALFATLFGVSLALFLDRGDEHRRAFEQVRRMLWLAVFGYFHFLLFWWGDILFSYAIAGMIALLFRDLAPMRLIGLGMAIFVVVSFFAATEVWGMIEASHAVVAGTAGPEQARWVADFGLAVRAGVEARMAEYAMPFARAIAWRLNEHPGFPLTMAAQAVFEALPLMLCGMGLARSGFFTGGWSRRALWRIAGTGMIVGLGWYGAMFAYEASQGFALVPVSWLAFRFGMIGRFAMVAGYLALIVLAAPAILRGAIGQRVAAAGRMAFSNYLGSTVVMTFLLHGWGLNLAAREYGHATLMLFVLGGWVAILFWSQSWLARFGIGPLEYAWRQLAGMGIRTAKPQAKG
ncbi:DUF418 domain-containing protein [Croceicoccus ponticola]|uniref:DUF418 domain-containing protein n=1 Tax=Croceicoccus ponticola TaxID=2217664 RepID=A0A437GVR2_9SPHN|nr:DUF418 domain-containing protein [Croceicoccus ponticola]RVQ65983.1 DUF418 domain-containing protein [Croceicoccus ponticola]